MKKLTTRLAILGLWLVSLTLVGGCEINKPEMPTYDTSVNIPLGVERIEIMDLVEDEEFLVVGGDSSLGFFIDGDPDTLAFDFELSADIGGQTVDQGLGNFHLPDADTMDALISIEGTEGDDSVNNRGALRAGVQTQVGPFIWDLGGSVGYVSKSEDWSLRTGLTVPFELPSDW